VTEYLLEFMVVISPGESTTIHLKSLDEDELSRDAWDALREAKCSCGFVQKARRAFVRKATMRLSPHEYGQAILTFVAGIEERGGEIGGVGGRAGGLGGGKEIPGAPWSPSIHIRSPFSSAVGFYKSTAFGNKLSNESTAYDHISIEETFASFKGILHQIERYFQKPDIIDERKNEDFVINVIPNAQPLTEQEKRMFKSLSTLKEELETKGKRLKGTVKSRVNKFFWTEGQDIWGSSR
jgi:hypothetical protein